MTTITTNTIDDRSLTSQLKPWTLFGEWETVTDKQVNETNKLTACQNLKTAWDYLDVLNSCHELQPMKATALVGKIDGTAPRSGNGVDVLCWVG